MPYRAEFNASRDFSAVRWWGELSESEIRDLFTEFPKLPGFRPGLNLFIDLRDCWTRLGWWNVRRVAEQLRGAEPAWGQSKWAVVVSSDVLFGLARVFAAFIEGCPVTIRVFRDPGQAEAWLRTTEAVPAALDMPAAAVTAVSATQKDVKKPKAR